MAEECHQKSHEYDGAVPESGDAEVKDRGLFDFLSKKEDHQKQDQEQVMAAEFEEKLQVSEVEDYEAKIEEQEKKEEKPSLLEKLRRSDSSSCSSSSDEEEGEDGEKKKKKKKKKKGLKEKLKEKISGEEKDAEKKHEEDTAVVVEKVEEVHAPVVYTEPPHLTPEPVHVTETPPVLPEEKKGFLEKIKEKIPGHKKADEASPPPSPAVVECPPPPPVVETPYEEPKEKKGILDKIKEKLPGYHSTKSEEEKEKGSSY